MNHCSTIPAGLHAGFEAIADELEPVELSLRSMTLGALLESVARRGTGAMPCVAGMTLDAYLTMLDAIAETR